MCCTVHQISLARIRLSGLAAALTLAHFASSGHDSVSLQDSQMPTNTSDGLLAAGRGGRGAAARAGPRGPSSSSKAAASLVQRGGGANATTGAGSERTQWLLLIDALKKR